MTEEEKIEEIAYQIQNEWEMSGLAEGLYLDFATKVALRYAATKEVSPYMEITHTP